MSRSIVPPAWGLLALFMLGGVLAPVYHQVEHVRQQQWLRVTAQAAHHVHADAATLCPSMPPDPLAHAPFCGLCVGLSSYLFPLPIPALPSPRSLTAMPGETAFPRGPEAGCRHIRGPPFQA